MPSITIASQRELQDSRDPIGLFAFEDGALAGAGALPAGLRKELSAKAADEDFKGKAGDLVSVRAALAGAERRFLLVGLGKKADFDGESARKGAAALYRSAKTRFKSLWVLAPGQADAAAEGILLAAHDFQKYKKPESETKLESVRLPAASAAERAKLQKSVQKAILYAEAVCFTRDLVNEGPSDKSPESIAKTASGLGANGSGVTVRVIEKAEAEKLGMGSYLGVARGSAKPPYFLHLVYKPKGKPKKRIGLVGKGITFDSGGLSLKPAQSMETMKSDMAGAASVLGVFKVLPRLGVKVEVHGFTPLAYNMPGPDAVKPGDVLKAMNGKTIEVLNTDAEGRLVLADALVLASRQNLDLIIDLATLTGAAVVALGAAVTAAMTNDGAALKGVLAAAKRTNESIWELPLVKDYKANIKSKFADLQNIGKARGEAGTIIGGLFLEEFVDGKPWIHLDIAGPAWTDSGNGYCGPGGTGAMVRTVLEYLRSL